MIKVFDTLLCSDQFITTVLGTNDFTIISKIIRV